MSEESHETKRPGPQTGHTVFITKPAIVVGRDKIPVPADEVEHMASLGCPDREIADYFGIKPDTLRRHFAAYLTKGRQQLKTSLRQAQIRLALEGNAVLLIWLGKNILQQNDSGTANDDQQPLPWSDDADSDSVADEELALAIESTSTTDS
ncbi:hypothetical protein UFOVP700_4 [uncultured Caudovirales phage]|uniref:Uncharacterized protein n=1 Tax=uncultured Caudovirales phage TaxID=2100421 RepID=A0A6J5NF52_9CAUD|nr:hypothetical protein UFOVP700_4 [uncultured Caudovirales phage]